MILADSACIFKSQTEKIRQDNIFLLNNVKLVLDIGSGNRPVSEGFEKAIKLDIDVNAKVDVVGDAHCIPFNNGVFDLAWVGGVFEHIKNPHKVIDEINRVLKERGYIYIEIPFFQRIHGAPEDYQRFTISGLKELCSRFQKIKSGIVCGPSSAFSHILRSYLALCFSFNNNILYHIFYYYIFGWLTLPIKYLDIILSKYKNADTVSFAFYYLGKKK